jgi:hypothetical protein
MGTDEKYNVDDLEAALIDVLDGNSKWYDIQNATGLSEERCIEIEELYWTVLDSYSKKHNIGG